MYLRSLISILCIHVLLVCQAGNEEPISEHFQNTPLREVFHILKEKYALKIAFSERLIATTTVSVELENATREQAIKQILSETEFEYEFIYPDAFIIKKGKKRVDSKTFNLTGEIIETTSNERLPFVYIYDHTNDKSYTSNEDGYFNLFNPMSFS